MKKRLECTISGRVQMVMFRDFVTRKAKSLQLVGRVWNNNDSTVSVIAEGDEEQLKALLVLLRKGPILASVTGVEEKWTTPTGEFSDFQVAY